MAWSAKQLEAIKTRGKNILVAAAAGSGKTSVLVERIIRRLTDEYDPITIDRLLVVTFTNAASSEMRERIGSALREAAQKEGGQHLRRQLLLLPSASISTMHAFCQSLIRRYIHLLPIDPKFRVAQQTELLLMEQDAMERLLLHKYEEQDADFLALVDAYSGDDSDDPLAALISQLYHFSCSQPWQKKWLSALGDSLDCENIDDTCWADILKRRIVIDLVGASLLAKEAVAMIDGFGDEAKPYAEALLSDSTQLDHAATVAQGGTWNEMVAVVNSIEFVRWPSKKWENDELKKILKDMRDKWKKVVENVAGAYFFATAEQFAEDMRATVPLMKALGELTIAYAEEYRAVKAEHGVLDFNDLEHYCLALLSEEDENGDIRPSDIARTLQKTYAEIMVDEYQDTNGVQEAIVQMLANPEKPNLFFVGDVKQSIYRFRLAEPELFLDKYHRYPSERYNHRIDLSQNFRSRVGVLSAVNDVFGSLMREHVTEIGYGEAERLNEGLVYPPHPRSFDNTAECHILSHGEDSGDGLSAVEREAVWIADYIAGLLAQGKVVYDKGLKDYRPLAKRDIVILLRSVKRASGILLDALRVRGVSGYAEDDSGYFESSEIRVFLSLLNIIDNPHQDIPLAAVLRSAIVGMTEEELTNVRLAGEGDLYDALNASAGTMKKAAAFLSQLDRWRTLARSRSVPELIWQLYQDTGYYDYVGAMASGTVRQANLEMLYDRAKAFEETDACGLFRFLRFIDKMLENDEDLGAAKDGGGENEDTVRIMSVHKSKGLEFPVVILANIGKQFNTQDMQKPILLHKSLGVGPYRVMAEDRYRYPTLARLAIAQQIISENHAEELRVLYVAMTRAREKLVMVGSTKDIEAMREKWTLLARHDELPDSVIVGARSWLDWIAPVLAKHEAGFELRSEVMETEMTYRDSEALWQIDYHHVCLEKEEAGKAEQTELIKRIKHMEAVDIGDDMTDINERLLWQYPNKTSVNLPAKLSVTEIKRRFAEHEEQATVPFEKQADSYEKPRFLQTKKRLDAAEYGTMMHTIMQMIDMDGDLTEGSIKSQVDALAQRELIPADLAKEVDCHAIARFFALPLGKRMRESKDVRRELPFGILIPAKEYYPEADDEETIFVQGVVDALFMTDTGWTLIDYKTDRFADAETLKDRYRVQISLYRRAVEQLTGIPVTNSYLYAFHTKRVIPIH